MCGLPIKTAATPISPDIHEQIEARLAPFMWKTILDTKGCISASSFSKYPAHTASGSASLSAKCRQIDGDVTPDTLRHRLDEHRLGLTRLQHQFDCGIEDFLAQLIAETIMNADGLDRLIARFRLVRDRVLPHAWSVFHRVATPRIPVHHAQELPIGGKLPAYFLLKSLTQSFPLEWRDVLCYQRLRQLHAGSPCGELCCAPRPVRG